MVVITCCSGVQFQPGLPVASSLGRDVTHMVKDPQGFAIQIRPGKEIHGEGSQSHYGIMVKEPEQVVRGWISRSHSSDSRARYQVKE